MTTIEFTIKYKTDSGWHRRIVTAYIGDKIILKDPGGDKVIVETRITEMAHGYISEEENMDELVSQ